ncbi:MAG: sulfur carrier protein ThiS [Verrucomicrobiae bacterium]|nr:sulfur carrier protein ThiS [Verrucomicrobiae bacterium]NNJ42047.1 sulfur carrier protein ThiS [Akkermansiaceae bacterium]
MTIHLNGKNHEIAAPARVDTLLAAIGLGDKPVVVELNQTALFPREYAVTTLEDGDKVEIITIAAGG